MNARKWITSRCKFAQAGGVPKIALTPQEEKIFGFLREVQEWAKLPGELRVAGGWTRDKLLGQESDDIDVALKGITGGHFQDYVERYAKLYQQRTGEPHPALGKAYTVRANPEKSKHLETVAIEIYGQKIDFVNLRSESYGNSRIPEMQMAKDTAEKSAERIDAERRDLTINSLFYNINTGQVEDHTGMGLDDLRTMTLRTPLNPEKTFMDDPLRMLRVLRFHSRYPNSTVSPDVVRAMADEDVQEQYRNKVDPKRAGPEITKMMRGSKPADSLRIMFDTGLDKSVFDVPETKGLKGLKGFDQKSSYHEHDLLDHTLLVVENMDKLSRQEGLPDDTRMKLNLAALFHDYGKAHPEIAKPHHKEPDKLTYKGHEEKSAEIADSIMRNIGMGHKDRDFVNKIVSMHMRPHSFEEGNLRPGQIGKFLRQTNIVGYGEFDEAGADPEEVALRRKEHESLWYYVFLHGMADAISHGTPASVDDRKLKEEHVRQFREYLSQPPPTKPLLDGNQIMGLFPNLKPGQWIKDVTQRLITEQESRNVVTQEDALGLIEGIRKEIESTYGKQFSKTSSWVMTETKINCRP